MKKIPIDIRSAADMPRCAIWITACVVLHNILIELRDEHEYVHVSDSDDDDDGCAVADQPTPQAEVFQNAVRDNV